MVPASDKHYTARILERRDLSEDLWVIRVDPGGPFQFKAGQYATLGVNPHICAGIQPCAKTDREYFSGVAGRRAPCLKNCISSQGKKAVAE
jgi:hypothetical protein